MKITHSNGYIYNIISDCKAGHNVYYLLQNTFTDEYIVAQNIKSDPNLHNAHWAQGWYFGSDFYQLKKAIDFMRYRIDNFTL